MPESKLTLAQLNQQIKESIQNSFPETYWVIAEISEFKINRNGHAYLELIEKENDSDKIKAKSRATIWSYTLRMLKPYFETTTNRTLSAGLKILVNVSIEFHELYGFSLNVKDIDPAYTLGDIERRRREIIEQLENDGILNLNKEIKLPLVIQKIAIISSDTAAGYEDFMNQLKGNAYGFKFYTHLFQAIMQGEQSESTIIAALEQIYEYEDFFDVVVIIRGGGAKADLMSFDKYDLAANIAQFPLPVISGIGHEKDISIVDMVSNTSVKTPTAAAEFILSHNADFEINIDQMFEQISSIVLNKIKEEQERVDLIARNFIPYVQNRLYTEKTKLSIYTEHLKNNSKQFILSKQNHFVQYSNKLLASTHFYIQLKQKMLERQLEKLSYRSQNQIKRNIRKLNYYEKSVMHLNPLNVLKKGYSITRLNGKAITDTSKIEAGNEIETVLYKGKIISKVEKKEK